MDESNYEPESLEDFISDLQKALECPICLDLVKKPFKQCLRGHLVCVLCLKNFSCCPTCKGELLLENPVCIKNLLAILPRSCCYSADGCEEIVQDINDHEKYCGFRRIKCRTDFCTQMILVKDLCEHLKTVHPDTFISEEDNASMLLPEFKSDDSYNDTNFYVFDNFFSICLDNSDKDQLKITFRVFPVGKLGCDYYAKVSLTNGHFGYMFTLKAFPAEENDLYDDRNEISRLEYFCMKIPKVMLSNFINKDGDLPYDLLVFKG